MATYVLDLEELDRTMVRDAGGKGAALGELRRIDGTSVPPGFCVPTAAFRRLVNGTPGLAAAIAGLDRLEPDDLEAVAERSAEVRRAVEAADVPAEVEAAVAHALERAGGDAWAVRSSATAEDSPTASFAGQHDTWLNVRGREAVLRGVRRCWASAFTDRAVAYRLRRGLSNDQAGMAVVVQRMVVPDASGVLFTADPVNGDRTVSCVEAAPGLGEALVSGAVDPDVFRVRDGVVLSRQIRTSGSALRASSSGGVAGVPVDPARRVETALTDAQLRRLVALGGRIEAHFGAPQDIEWCLADDELRVVQSRPITTLFPVPHAEDDAFRVYLSVGHQQMMTDAMKPLGLSLFQATALPRMHEAAGRLFVDVAPRLALPGSRAALLRAFDDADPLVGSALRTIVDRGDLAPPADEGPGSPPGDEAPVAPPADPPQPAPVDPSSVDDLIARTEASLSTLERDIAPLSGAALLAFIEEDVPELKRRLFDPRSTAVILAAFEATAWLNEHLETWLGERNVADVLTRSAPGNITSEMGLALLDVADVLRAHPDVVAFLEGVEDDRYLERLGAISGGVAVRGAVERFLDRYGMRCVGEIDVTRPRWRERPSALLPVLLGNVRRFEAGEARRRFAEGREQASAKEREVLARLRALPDGERKAEETARTIERLRRFIGYREYPKYGFVCRYGLYRQALVREARRLADRGVLRAPDDADFLRLEELAVVARTGTVDHELIDRRRRDFDAFRALVPPRVITSNGEVVPGTHARDGAPEGALPGLAVSTGVVEGRARIVHDLADADLEPGDVLVTAYTDPSWSPLFVAAAALVTEVGGLMTHGAVVAREYGLPAVVGVEHATRLIRDGRRIRVNGTDGFVELLD